MQQPTPLQRRPRASFAEKRDSNSIRTQRCRENFFFIQIRFSSRGVGHVELRSTENFCNLSSVVAHSTRSLGEFISSGELQKRPEKNALANRLLQKIVLTV